MQLGEGQIRLFHYENSHSTITGHMTIHNLSDLPVYKALSYTCAKPYLEVTQDRYGYSVISHDAVREEPPGVTIVIDGHPHIVTSNLFSALRDLDVCRARVVPSNGDDPDNGSNALWIDAICIDHSNVVERSAQVQLMGTIYSRAKAVVVYLGHDHEFGSSFQWCMNVFIERLKVLEVDVLERFVGSRVLSPELHKLLGFQNNDGVLQKLQEMTRYLMQCRWFYRLWTFQETILAKIVTVFIGTRNVDWDNTLNFVHGCSYLDWGTPLWDYTSEYMDVEALTDPFINVYTRRRIKIEATRISRELLDIISDDHRGGRHKYVSGQLLAGERYQCLRFADLIYCTRTTDCFDKRDRVLGCLGIAQVIYCPLAADLVNVDYTVDWKTLYIRVWTALLTKSQSLDLLALIPDPASNLTAGLPTWVNNFDTKNCTLPLWSDIGGIKMTLNVLGNSQEDIPIFSINDLRLNCSGAHFDEINSTVSVDKKYGVSASDFVHFGQLLPPFVNGRRRLEVLWRTLLLDGAEYRDPVGAEYEVYFLAYLLSWFATGMERGAEKHETESELNKELVDRFCKGFRQFDQLHLSSSLEGITTEQRQMLSPEEVKPTLLWYLDAIQAMSQSEGVGTGAFRWNTRVDALRYLNLPSADDRFHTFQKHVSVFLKNIQRNDRRIFQTSRGLCGSGLAGCEPGDQIWVLGQAHTPYVLRPVKQMIENKSGLQFHLVGECYVLDFMNGEIMRPEIGVANNFQSIEIL